MIKIFYFPFKNNQIMGCFFTGNKIAVNSTSFSPSDMKFISFFSHNIPNTLESLAEVTFVNSLFESNFTKSP